MIGTFTSQTIHINLHMLFYSWRLDIFARTLVAQLYMNTNSVFYLVHHDMDISG